MDTNDITPHVLATLRRDMADLRADMETGFKRVDARMDRMDARMGGMDARMEQGFDLLGKRITETETRLATAVFGLEGKLDDTMSMLRALNVRLGLRKRPNG